LDDKKIIQLYWDRDERAISETDSKYGAFCSSIAENILDNKEDSKECVNDTYLKTWNALPPQWPKVFPAFIGRIVRNLAINRYNSERTAGRGGGQTAVALEELEECISDRSAEISVEESELSEAIDSFLGTLSRKNRQIFVLRYWYTESVSYISEVMNMTENSVSVALNRMRKKLLNYLSERGFKQ